MRAQTFWIGCLIYLVSAATSWAFFAKSPDNQPKLSGLASPAFFWGKSCENERTDWKRWHLYGDVNRVKICADQRIFFYSEFVPTVQIATGQSKHLEIRQLNITCNDIFEREYRDLDVLVCPTGRSGIQQTTMLRPNSPHKQWMIWVRDTKMVEEFAEDGVRLNARVWFKEVKPKKVEFPPAKVVNQRPCGPEFYRSRDCISLNFPERGSIYTFYPKYGQNGEQYCLFAASSPHAKQFKYKDGRVTYVEFTNRVQNPFSESWTVFFYLAPGEHIGRYRCR